MTGTVSFSGVGAGSLTLTDGTVSTVVSATGTSPQSYTLTGLVSDGANHTVTAVLSNTVCSPFSVTYTAPASCSVTPVLTLVKSVSRSRASVGDLLTYSVVLTNSGTALATATTVRDSLGTGVTYLTGSAVAPASTSFVPGNPVSLWQVPALAAGQSLTLTFQARADSMGILYNTATIPGDTVTACTSVPVRVCVGETYLFRLSAPAGRSSYRWYKDGVELTAQTGNTLDITAPGAYSLAVDDVTGKCPDFSCCPYIVVEDSLPRFQATAVAATCVGNVPQANGRIVLSGYDPTHTYQYSAGTSFNPAASLSGAPKALATAPNGVIVGNLTGVTTPTQYTVRVYNGAGCFTDVIVTLAPTTCVCPTDVCAPFIVSRTRSGPGR